MKSLLTTDHAFRLLFAVCALVRWMETTIDEAYPLILRPVVVLFGNFLLQHEGIKLFYPPQRFLGPIHCRAAIVIQRQFRLWAVSPGFPSA
jgi:hypothetical protein